MARARRAELAEDESPEIESEFGDGLWPGAQEEQDDDLRRREPVPDLDPMRSGCRPNPVTLGLGYRVKGNNQRDYMGGTLTEAQWSGLLLVFGDLCAYCRTSKRGGVVIEHVRPIVHGGRTNIDNVVPACSECNRRKGRKTLERWRGQEWADNFRRQWGPAIQAVKEKAR